MKIRVAKARGRRIFFQGWMKAVQYHEDLVDDPRFGEEKIRETGNQIIGLVNGTDGFHPLSELLLKTLVNESPPYVELINQPIGIERMDFPNDFADFSQIIGGKRFFQPVFSFHERIDHEESIRNRRVKVASSILDG